MSRLLQQEKSVYVMGYGMVYAPPQFEDTGNY